MVPAGQAGRTGAAAEAVAPAHAGGACRAQRPHPGTAAAAAAMPEELRCKVRARDFGSLPSALNRWPSVLPTPLCRPAYSCRSLYSAQRQWYRWHLFSHTVNAVDALRLSSVSGSRRQRPRMQAWASLLCAELLPLYLRMTWPK